MSEVRSGPSDKFDPLRNFAEWCLGASEEAPGMVAHIKACAQGALDQADGKCHVCGNTDGTHKDGCQDGSQMP